MKTKTVFALILAAIFTSCSNTSSTSTENSTDNTDHPVSNEESEMMWAGTISKAEATFYQYGTHQLEGSALDGNPENIHTKTRYALKSDNVNLDEWIGQDVIITGKKVEGYPLEGGPDFISVSVIEVNQKVGTN